MVKVEEGGGGDVGADSGKNPEHNLCLGLTC